MNGLKIYLAGPLFSVAEQEFNRNLRDVLEERRYCVLLPQEQCAPLVPNMKAIYSKCIADLESADLVVAILDGATADDGTCYECGYAKGKQKPLIGIRTDFRLCESSESHVNAMLAYGCDVVILPKAADSLAPVLTEIADRISAFVAEHCPACKQKELACQ